MINPMFHICLLFPFDFSDAGSINVYVMISIPRSPSAIIELYIGAVCQAQRRGGSQTVEDTVYA